MVVRRESTALRLRHRLWRGLPLAALAFVAFVAGVAVQRLGLIGKSRLLLRQLPARLGVGEPLPRVPVVTIDMSLRAYLRVVRKREEALREGILFAAAADYVPATLSVGGRAVRVKMRLKGGGRDHWRGDKWSFRVKVRDDQTFFGMRVFSLQHPQTRNFDLEWLHQRHQRREGVLALRYLLVRLVLNGEDKGIYAVEEHLSKELLESQGRQPGLVVQFEEGGPDAGGRRASGQGSGLAAHCHAARRGGAAPSSPHRRRDPAIAGLQGGEAFPLPGRGRDVERLA